MAILEFFAKLAFIDWCATHPPHWEPPHIPEDADPTKELQGWATKPWVAQAITRFHYFIVAGLILLVSITNHDEVFNLRYGPFLIVPGYRIFVALLPRYKPYGGVWDKIRESAEQTPLPGFADKIKEQSPGNPLSGFLGKDKQG